jgi:hypothetical protein
MAESGLDKTGLFAHVPVAERGLDKTGPCCSHACGRERRDKSGLFAHVPVAESGLDKTGLFAHVPVAERREISQVCLLTCLWQREGR